MAHVVRISEGDRWRYVPATPELLSKISKAASAGVARIVEGGVSLRSESGPVVWESLTRRERREPSTRLADCLGDNYVSLAPNERLALGRQSDEYDDICDVSLLRGRTDVGLRTKMADLGEGDVVLTAWGREVVPARISRADKNPILMELETEKNGRCFVLDPQGRALVSIGRACGHLGTILKPRTLASWLAMMGSKSMPSRRFSARHQDDHFVVTDADTGRSYVGRYKDLDAEQEKIDWTLGLGGLGALLSLYELENPRGD